MSQTTLLESAELARLGAVRHSSPDDAIDGVLPRAVVEPDTPEAVAAVLAWASRERLTVVLRGRGTKLAWGRRPDPIDLLLSMRRLARVVAHVHGDLTATVEAGATIGDLNQQLARHRQWLPLDVPFDQATIGGTLATNDAGPLRHRYGAPRDLVIGVRLAMPDGRLAKAGGVVVKNVAGYDLGKLISGSFGSFAAIVSATFKLTPMPMTSSTLTAAFSNFADAARAAAAIGSSQLDPTAFEVAASAMASAHGDRAACRLFLRFASTPEAVDAQLDQARQLMDEAGGPMLEVLRGEGEERLWRDHARRLWNAPGAMIRVAWLPAALQAVLALVEDVGRATAGPVELVGRAGVGAGLIRIDADQGRQVAAVERLRAQRDVVGHVVLLRADPAVKEKADVWGPPGDAAHVLRALKRALDPAGILNAGRGPV